LQGRGADIDGDGDTINNHGMKTRTLEIPVARWPYALAVEPVANGLLLRPGRKARAGWTKAFRQRHGRADELGPVREVPNRFDSKEWQW
jgi:hypothetical protein